MNTPGDRIGPVGVVGYAGLSIVAAFVFFVLARWGGDAPPLAIVGGAVWVFILSMIVSMPLMTRRGPRRPPSEPPPRVAPAKPALEQGDLRPGVDSSNSGAQQFHASSGNRMVKRRKES